jgi:poly(3-hydroxybutyrate) depolymerase
MHNRNNLFFSLMSFVILASCSKKSAEENPVTPASGMYVSPQFEPGEIQTEQNIRYSQRPNINDRQYTSDKNRAQEAGDPMLDLHLDIAVPPNATNGAPQPLVITVHGGGFSMGSKEDITASAISYARAGYVAANINYRLTEINSSNPAAFIQAVIHATDDAMNAVRFLKANASLYHIDTTRIAIVGYSAGGGIALINAMAYDALAGTSSDFPGISSKVHAALSTGATLVQPGIPSPASFFSFDRNDSPVMLFHANPVDNVMGTTWNNHVLPTQKLITDAGNECVVVEQPDRTHTVDLSVGANYWSKQREFLWKHLRLREK